jgi:hypothetical protein
MDMIVKIKKLSRMSVLLLIAISVILLTGCGKAGTPPPGAALTITKDVTTHSTNPINTTDIKTQKYRVAVVDSDGNPLDGVIVNIQASFTSGDNIVFNGSSVTTGDFGLAYFTISAPTYSIGPLANPVAIGSTGVTSGGNLSAIPLLHYGVTATDAAGVETMISNIVTATTTTSGSSVKVTWQAVSRATGYILYGDEGTPTLGKLTTILLDSAVCDPITLICSSTDTGSVLAPTILPPTTNNSGLGLNPVKGTLTATSGALLTTLDISQ